MCMTARCLAHVCTKSINTEASVCICLITLTKQTFPDQTKCIIGHARTFVRNATAFQYRVQSNGPPSLSVMHFDAVWHVTRV